MILHLSSRLERFCLFPSGACSPPPDTDLSVLPIVPPVLPAWANATRSVASSGIKQTMQTTPKVTGLRMAHPPSANMSITLPRSRQDNNGGLLSIAALPQYSYSCICSRRAHANYGKIEQAAPVERKYWLGSVIEMSAEKNHVKDD
jgi:hypothetical protein